MKTEDQLSWHTHLDANLMLACKAACPRSLLHALYMYKRAYACDDSYQPGSQALGSGKGLARLTSPAR